MENDYLVNNIELQKVAKRHNKTIEDRFGSIIDFVTISSLIALSIYEMCNLISNPIHKSTKFQSQVYNQSINKIYK